MTDTTTDFDRMESERELKKPAKEIPIIQDQGSFRHDTGDTYEGHFEAKKKDRSVRMNGPGVYITAEGDIYSGYWESDKLGAKEEVTIAFTDGSKYEGPIRDFSYYSSGKYSYPDGSLLECEFNENCPIGALTLKDPNGHVWLGKAEQGYGWLEPVNHYYGNLEKTLKHARKTKTRSIKSARSEKSDGEVSTSKLSTADSTSKKVKKDKN